MNSLRFYKNVSIKQFLQHYLIVVVQLFQEYAERMQKLATQIWDKNNSKGNDLCRIHWVVNQSEEYFHKGGCEKAAQKEDKLSENYFKISMQQQMQSFADKKVLKLLDVGSCYNPFSKCSIFDVTAIDLMPAVSDVFKCDFLTVETSSNILTVRNQCFALPLSYFDIVVFSLLLEYFPSSKQRFKCCEKAFQLIRAGGLLFILTPDSKHATANSRVMKSWRYSLASIGFLRVSYKKLKHLHCMAYRKCFNSDVPKYWFSNQHCDKEPEDLMYIPQDFHEYDDRSLEVKPVKERSEFDNKLLVDIFSGLPGSDVF